MPHSKKGLVHRSRTRPVRHEVDKNIQMTRELHQMQDERIKNIARRNETLRANAYYNSRLERERTMAAFSRVSSGQQRDLIRAYLGDLERRMHRIAKQGFLPSDLQPS